MPEIRSDHDQVVNVQIGKRLAAWRIATGLTIRELAERLGWPHTTLGNYESGRRALPIARLFEIAAVLNHAPAALLVDSPEAASIIDQIVHNPERCVQVAYVLETLDDPLPELPDRK
jgi:transcriptional regulator with XRE-family HTH domain